MCGILCEICYMNTSSITLTEDDLFRRMCRRGPDCAQRLEYDIDVELVEAHFHGSVLWMQGTELTPQPVNNMRGILLFNGDIFDETWACDVSDTQLLMDKLTEETNGNREDQIIRIFRSLKGPFSIIYFDKDTCNLYFTRDRTGRSSLLFHRDNTNRIIISSVLGRKYQGCLEVPADNIYSLNTKEKLIHMYSWTDYFGPDVLPLDDWFQSQSLQQSIPDNEFPFDFYENMDLSESHKMISDMENKAREITDKLTLMKSFLDYSEIKEAVLKMTQLLEESVRIRVRRQPNKCKKCVLESPPCNHCTVGVLFSGGLDCTILALLADKFLPETQPIDLMNVAFSKNDQDTFDVPDRITGWQSYKELVKLCPSRKWEFKEVNVSRKEVEKFQTVIADLVYPRKTILDESLGTALWFAARGKDRHDSVSSCRVLLLGSGADELFGGYTRHRNAFKRQSWTGLAKELMLDWKRISMRNLSRDNRVISDHSRQPRLPYLDDDFTKYVLQLKPWLKCFPSNELGPGIGDKLMLRLVALNLGLSEVATLPKRALQFGSRIANKKEKGSDISKSFENQ